jgi:hypothetical protein
LEFYSAERREKTRLIAARCARSLIQSGAARDFARQVKQSSRSSASGSFDWQVERRAFIIALEQIELSASVHGSIVDSYRFHADSFDEFDGGAIVSSYARCRKLDVD